MTENEISYKIIGIAIDLHRNVGPGLLESAYENALAYDLRESGLDVKQQLPLPFLYKEVKMEVGYRVDLLVENKVIIEVKSVETLAQVLNSGTNETLLSLKVTPNDHHLIDSACKRNMTSHRAAKRVRAKWLRKATHT